MEVWKRTEFEEYVFWLQANASMLDEEFHMYLKQLVEIVVASENKQLLHQVYKVPLVRLSNLESSDFQRGYRWAVLSFRQLSNKMISKRKNSTIVKFDIS